MTQTINNWIETRWQVPKFEAEDLTARLEIFNSLGSFENMDIDPEKELQRNLTELIVYFPDQSDIDAFSKVLRSMDSDTVKLQAANRIPQGDWATAWKQYFKPFFLTPQVVIRPSWEPYELQGKEMVVTLDPGMAFGTGQHDTTRFCSEFLCEIKTQYPQFKSLLDIGCGSGILSLIGKKLGFTPVLGVDIDPAAVETALENLERNPDVGEVQFYLNQGDLSDPFLKPADVVVSNIIAETLCELKSQLLALVKPNSLLILSGILPERHEMIETNFNDLELLAHKTSNHWHAYLYRKK